MSDPIAVSKAAGGSQYYCPAGKTAMGGPTEEWREQGFSVEMSTPIKQTQRSPKWTMKNL
jgi:hypothetical protein